MRTRNGKRNNKTRDILKERENETTGETIHLYIAGEKETRNRAGEGERNRMGESGESETRRGKNGSCSFGWRATEEG